MIVDEVVRGWLVTAEQLAKFAELEIRPLPDTQHGLRLRTPMWLSKEWPRLHPLSTRYPRLDGPRTAPYRIIFPTRGRREIDHRYTFVEADEDRRLRQKIMNSRSSITVLLTNADFVTVPIPTGTIILPGEFVVVEPVDSDSDEVHLSYFRNLLELYELTCKLSK